MNSKQIIQLNKEAIGQLLCPSCIQPCNFRYRLEPCLHTVCSNCAKTKLCKMCNICNGKIFRATDALILHYKLVHHETITNLSEYIDKGDPTLVDGFTNLLCKDL